MKLLLIPTKLIAVPVALACWMVKMVGTFVTMMSGWVFYAISSLLFGLAVVTMMFGLSTFKEMIPTFICSFCVFAVPYIAAAAVGTVAAAGSILREFIFG